MAKLMGKTLSMAYVMNIPVGRLSRGIFLAPLIALVSSISEVSESMYYSTVLSTHGP